MPQPVMLSRIVTQTVHQTVQVMASPSNIIQPGVQTIYFEHPDMTQTPMFADKFKMFSGYMHEDGPKFLSEFESYLTRLGIYSTSESRKEQVIAAFHPPKKVVYAAKRNKPKIEPSNVTKEKQYFLISILRDFRYLNSQIQDLCTQYQIYKT